MVDKEFGALEEDNEKLQEAIEILSEEINNYRYYVDNSKEKLDFLDSQLSFAQTDTETFFNKMDRDLKGIKEIIEKMKTLRESLKEKSFEIQKDTKMIQKEEKENISIQNVPITKIDEPQKNEQENVEKQEKVKIIKKPF